MKSEKSEPSLFSSIEEQMKRLYELLQHVHVGSELYQHLAWITREKLPGEILNPFACDVVIVPGMDRREIEVLRIALQQQGMKLHLAQMSVEKTNSQKAHDAGTPRVVRINLQGHRAYGIESAPNLSVLADRPGSYVSSIATLWAIALNPDYAQWLAHQEEFRFIMLPGIDAQHSPGDGTSERVVLGIAIEKCELHLRWFALDSAPAPSVTPVVIQDAEAAHLRPGALPADDDASGDD